MDKAIDTTAKALASLSHHVGSGKEQGPSKSFQNLIRMIGEAKTKHVRMDRMEVAGVAEVTVEHEVAPGIVVLCSFD